MNTNYHARINAHRLNLRKKVEYAANNPESTIHALFARHGFGTQAGRYLEGASPLVAFGSDAGEDPAGFITRADLPETLPGQIGTTKDGQSVVDIWAELQVMLTLFNQAAVVSTARLTFDVNAPIERVGVPTSPGFQRATELGRPSKIRLQFVSGAFPINHFDLADGYTQEFIDSSTGAEITAVQMTIFNEWSQLNKELVFDAIFGDTNYTTKDGELVKRLYNGDGEVPPKIKRWEHNGNHTHYLVADSPGTPDADDLDTMSEHLIHHGFREFGSDATFYLHVHRDDLQDIRDMTGFIHAATAERATVIDGQIVGTTRGSGSDVEGYIGDWTIVQDNDMQPGYWLGYVSGGSLNGRNVVGVRQHDNESIRGLRLIEGPRQNYPLYDSVYDGYVGAGVGQRGAAVVMDTQNAAYNVPTWEIPE